MSLVQPTIFVEDITNVKIETLKKMNIKAVFLDVDNTLCSYRSKVPLKGAIEWVENVKKNGFSVYIVSNNYKKRVSIVAETYKLPFVSFAMKPLPMGFNKAANLLSLKKRECLIIGDQIFTDVLGANLAGMQSVLVEPIETEKGLSIEIRRKLEVNIKAKLNKVEG